MPSRNQNLPAREDRVDRRVGQRDVPDYDEEFLPNYTVYNSTVPPPPMNVTICRMMHSYVREHPQLRLRIGDFHELAVYVERNRYSFLTRAHFSDLVRRGYGMPQEYTFPRYDFILENDVNVYTDSFVSLNLQTQQGLCPIHILIIEDIYFPTIYLGEDFISARNVQRWNINSLVLVGTHTYPFVPPQFR